MKAKEFIPATKPRNFVAKNQQIAGAGAHKDKKRAEKQGDLKHKKSLVPMESVLRDKEDLQAKRKALQDLSMNKGVDQTAVQQRKIDLEKEAKKQGMAEDVEEEPGPQHRVAVKITDPNTYDDVQKIVKVDATDKQDALDKIEEYYGKKGIYIVSIKYIGMTEQGVKERVRDPEDWDEGNTEPGNNFAVYINGKKWKVFPGPYGAYADSPEEKREFQRLQAMTQRKSQETGKKWEVYITGEPATK